MSLGITAIWRARPLRLGSSIPREPIFTRPRPPRPSSFPARLGLGLRCIKGMAYSSATEKRVPASREQQNEAGSSSEKPKTSSRQPRRRKSPNLDPEGLQEVDVDDDVVEIKKIESELERSHFAHSVLVKSPQPYSDPTEVRESWREHHETVSAQVYHERNRENVGARSADWRKVMEIMAQHTPEESLEWIEGGMKIEVSQGVLAGILDHGGDDKIGSIRRRTGAAIKVSRDDATLLVSGTRRAINRATEEFRRIAGNMTITRLYSPLGPGEVRTEDLKTDENFWTPPLTREEGAYWRRRKIKQHIYTLPMPLTWTPKSLEDYVTALVDTSVERSLHAPIYGQIPGQILVDHERATVRRLKQVFQTVPAHTAASCSAYKLAFSYLCERGDKYLPEARRLFVLMDRHGLRMDTDVFNLLLRAPVKTRNLRKFQQTLGMMVDRGYAPNLDTWLLFLRLFESVKVRSYILQAMHFKNLLGTSEAIERVAKEMATLDAGYAVRAGKDLPTFLKEQEERYGRSWLTRDAGNQVLDVLSAHGRFHDAFAFLDKMAENHALIPQSHVQERLAARPDTTSFNTIISHAKVKGKMPLAVNILRKMKTRNLARQPNTLTMHLLFEMAWKARMRTSIVVLWRYAVLARALSWRMRVRVAALLSGKVEADPDARDSTQRILTASVHRALGGEAMARELAGGPRALQRLRALAARFEDGKPQPQAPRKISALASRALSGVFEGFGPSTALGRVLAQAVLVDLRCMRAKKAGTLRDLMATAKVKRMTMWQRRPVDEDGWVDLAPVERLAKDVRISPDDEWVDQWQSEGWEVPHRVWGEEADAKDGPESSPRGTESDTCQSTKDVEPEPATMKRMAIINPRVWADDPDEGDLTKLQLQNEQAILSALEELSESYGNSMPVSADSDEEYGLEDLEEGAIKDATRAGAVKEENA